MSSKNITVFETTYEKVLSIINKVKDFIKKNTNNFQNIIDELDWVSQVITNKTLYSYEVNKEKLSDDNPKFSDFITKYNEEIINLNKKHILVRDILSFKTNKEFLKKPSLILKKISSKELTELTHDDKNTNKNTAFNPLGKWLMNIVNKKQEESVKTEENINKPIINKSPDNKQLNKEKGDNKTNFKSLSASKNKKINEQSKQMASSLTSIIINKKKEKEKNKSNKIKQPINKNKMYSSYMRNKNSFNFNIHSMNKTMEIFFKNEMELKRQKNINKNILEKKA